MKRGKRLRNVPDSRIITFIRPFQFVSEVFFSNLDDFKDVGNNLFSSSIYETKMIYTDRYFLNG